MELPISSTPAPFPPSRTILEMLMASSIRRCVTSRNPCRVTISLRCFYDSNPSPRVQISVSDTGMGSSLEELQNIDDYCHKTMVKWDGTLSATTTCIEHSDIFSYRFNLNETASTTLTKLPPKPKNGNKFSGTQISLTIEIEETMEEHLGWVQDYVRKIPILNIPMIAFEILVDHVKDTGSTQDHVRFSDGVFLPLSLSSIERITAGLQDYLLKHGNVMDKECSFCFANKDDMKIGKGYATTENRKGNGQRVEAIIAMVNSGGTSSNSCSWTIAGSRKVLYFQDFVPCSMSLSTINAVKGISWEDYGLSIRRGFLDGNGQAVLEWENLSTDTHVDIVLHCHDKQYPIKDVHLQGQSRPPEKSLLKRAVKLALDDLKSKYVGVLLSHRASKIRSYAPDLSRSIAGLILSSNDVSFRGECASLLGLKPLDIESEGKLELCIRDKMLEIIDMNDRNPKRSRQDNSSLFESESVDGEENPAEDYEWGDEGCAMGREF